MSGALTSQKQPIPETVHPEFSDLQTPYPKPPRTKDHSGPYATAAYLQRLIIHRAGNPKISGQTLAQLCRAWTDLEERKRILRGKPLPGNLRPDLDPVQLAKATKRLKARVPLEIGAAISPPPAFTEEPDKESIIADGPSPHPQGERTDSIGGLSNNTPSTAPASHIRDPLDDGFDEKQRLREIEELAKGQGGTSEGDEAEEDVESTGT